MAWLVLVLFFVVSYSVGSINAAIIITRSVAHKDVREFGSGNAGMTNVMRVAGVVPGVLTLLFDAVKGSIVCLIAKLWVFPYVFENLGIEAFRPEYAVYYCGFLCLIGHIFPVFFGFHGGKGVATTLGIMLVCQYQSALIALGLFLIIFIITRIISVGSILAAISLPFLNIVFAKGDGNYSVLIQCLLMSVLSLLIIFMHRKNIVRILHGEEKKLSVKKKET